MLRHLSGSHPRRLLEHPQQSSHHTQAAPHTLSYHRRLADVLLEDKGDGRKEARVVIGDYLRTPQASLCKTHSIRIA